MSRQQVDLDAKNGSSADSGIRDLLAKGAPEAEVATRFNMPEQLVWSIGVARLTRLGWTQREIADHLEVSQPSVAGDIKNGSSAVSDMRDLLAKGAPEAEVATRAGKVARLTRLGWTSREIADRLDVAKGSVPTIGELADSGQQVRDLLAKGAPEAEVATRFNMPEQLVWSIGVARLTRLGWTQREIADHLEVSQPSVAGDIKNGSSAVSDMRDLLAKGAPEAEVATRAGKVARLTRLGWTQQQIADRLDVDRKTVHNDIENFGSSAVSPTRDLLDKGAPEAEVATRFNMPDQPPPPPEMPRTFRRDGRSLQD